MGEIEAENVKIININVNGSEFAFSSSKWHNITLHIAHESLFSREEVILMINFIVK